MKKSSRKKSSSGNRPSKRKSTKSNRRTEIEWNKSYLPGKRSWLLSLESKNLVTKPVLLKKGSCKLSRLERLKRPLKGQSCLRSRRQVSKPNSRLKKHQGKRSFKSSSRLSRRRKPDFSRREKSRSFKKKLGWSRKRKNINYNYKKTKNKGKSQLKKLRSPP